MAIIIDVNEGERVWDLNLKDDSSDGSGFTLTVPTLMIPKKQGDMLISYLAEDKVVLQAKLDLTVKAGSMVEYSVWYGSLFDLTPE